MDAIDLTINILDPVFGAFSVKPHEAEHSVLLAVQNIINDAISVCEAEAAALI